MSGKLKITFLGTGSALGVPQLGCCCGVCVSDEPFNKRRRTCFLVQTQGRSFLLDPGPDVRAQLLSCPLEHLDGVIITHAHYDHIGGFDELRMYAFKQGRALETLIHEKNSHELMSRCGYLLKHKAPYFNLELLTQNQGEGVFQGLAYRYLTYSQNGMNVTGFVIEGVAFISDLQTVDESVIAAVKGVTTLIVSCVMKPSNSFKSHLNLDEITTLKHLTGAKTVIITHMGHDMDYSTLSLNSDPHTVFSYDGFIYQV